MNKCYLTGAFILPICTGMLMACSSDDTQIPTPEPQPEVSQTIQIKLQLVRPENYNSATKAKDSRTSANDSGDGIEYQINKDDYLSIYEKGTENRLGTLACIDADKALFGGTITAKEFSDKKEYYVALDNNADDNIKWDGKAFTFINCYNDKNYSGFIGNGNYRFKTSYGTQEGYQTFYELGKGTLSLDSDKTEGTMTAYLNGMTPLAGVYLDNETGKYIRQTVQAKSYTYLTLKVQTDNKVVNTFTYNPEDLSFTFNYMDTNVRKISYKVSDISWGGKPILLFAIDPGLWKNPTIEIYGGTDDNKESEKLASVRIPAGNIKMNCEFVSPEKTDWDKATQRPLNRLFSFTDLVKE